MNERFFEKFEKVNKKQWLEKATADLKGEDPLSKFSWELEPGINLDPYYAREDVTAQVTAFQNRLLAPDHPSGQLRYWDNLQKITYSTESKCNTQALQALEGGAEGIVFDLGKTAEIDLTKLLKDVKTDFCAVWFKMAEEAEAINTIVQHFSKLTWHGGIIIQPEKLTPALAKTVIGETSGIVTITQDTAGSFTERIAQLLFHVAEIAEKVISEEIKADRFFMHFGLQYPLGNNFFGEIASMRALRQLHFQVARAFRAEQFQPEDLHINARCYAWSSETYDPHANMLKSTTAGMAGIIGGCSSLLVEPADSNNAMMTRIARNVSNILKEEAYLSSSADPAAGAYYLEALTDTLAKKAWQKFQQKIN